MDTPLVTSGIHQLGASSETSIPTRVLTAERLFSIRETTSRATSPIPNSVADRNLVLTTKQPTLYHCKQDLPHGTVIIQQSSPPQKLYQLPGLLLTGLGVTQLVLASALAVLNGIALVKGSIWADIGHGFWTAVFFITSGVLAGVAGDRKTRALVAACLWTNLASIIIGVSGLGVSISALIHNTSNGGHFYEERVAVNTLMVVAFVAGTTCAMAVCLLCLMAGVCCVGNTCCLLQTNVIVPYHPTAQGAAAFITTADGTITLIPVQNSVSSNALA